jgi:hypothetical protein
MKCPNGGNGETPTGNVNISTILGYGDILGGTLR